jgi:6-pyruvoyltetrahydropterin/6-carboxytetrahydropterin synthase
VTIFKAFKIDVAHRLTMVPEGHKCANMHGHTFRIEVSIRGPVTSQGWVMDFADIAEAFKPIHDSLDHKCLNDIEGLDNPTSENLARWLWARLKDPLPGLCKIIVQENPYSGCVYEGEDD